MSGGPPLMRALGRCRLELALAALVVLLFGDYLFGTQILYGSDSVPGGVFTRKLNVDFVRNFGELPRWNPFLVGGLPYIDAQHGDTFFPTSILHFLMPVQRAMGHKLVLHVLVAGLCMAFYLRTLRLSPPAVAFGATAYLLCPVLVSLLFAGHDGRLYVSSLTPLVLGLVERAFESGRLAAFVRLGLALGLTILSAQIQMAYHLMWIVFVLVMLRWWQGRSARPTLRSDLRLGGFCALSVVIAVAMAAIQLFPAVAYVKHPAGFSVRSAKTDYEHASSWSLHPEEIMSMIVPEFCNAPRGYWGRNAFKYNADYIGVLTIALAAAALARRRDATRWFLAGTAVVAIAYSLGEHTPVHRLFYWIVPQVRLFRAPPLVMFTAACALCALAAHAIHDLTDAGNAKSPRSRKPAESHSRVVSGMVGAGVLLGLVAIFAPSFTSAWNDAFGLRLSPQAAAIQTANLPDFRSGAWLGAGVLLLGAGALWAWAAGRIAPRWALAALLLLSLIDLWRVDRRFKLLVDDAVFFRPVGAIATIAEEARAEKFRVMPVVESLAGNELGYFGIESTLGFHDNELTWYRDLRAAPEAGGLLASGRGDYPFLRMLNVKYILHDQPDAPNPFPVPGYLPRFWIAGSWEVLARSAIPARIADPSFDVGKTVLLEQDPRLQSPSGGADPAGDIVSYDYSGNRVHVSIQAHRDCLLVHSENWFPYWHAYEGETEIPILRANGTIRAIPLRAGRHDLTLRYRSMPYEIGKGVTAIVLLTCAGVLLLELRRRGSRSRAVAERDA